MTEYLDLEDLLAAAGAALGHPAQVGDIGLMLAALARPQATAFGEDAYRSLDDKAAALLHSLVTGHPLVDGNKRLGWVALRLFYLLNGEDISPPPEAAFELIVDIAGAELQDVPTISARIRAWRT